MAEDSAVELTPRRPRALQASRGAPTPSPPSLRTCRARAVVRDSLPPVWSTCSPSATPHSFVPCIEQLIDALYRPEAQTRWEILDALTLLAPEHAKECGAAYEGAESALFDEISAPLRLSAFRFLTVWGATERRRSEKVWPIIDEAIQCYHGDLEYRDMLALLFALHTGKSPAPSPPSSPVACSSMPRNGKGSYLRVRSREIYDALVKRFKLDNPQKKVRAKKSEADDEDEE